MLIPAALTALACAQTPLLPRILLTDGDILSTGEVVDGLVGLAVSNDAGGYAIKVALGSNSADDVIWGTYGAAAPGILARESDFTDLWANGKIGGPIAMNEDGLFLHTRANESMPMCTTGFIRYEGQSTCLNQFRVTPQSVFLSMENVVLPELGAPLIGVDYLQAGNAKTAVFRLDSTTPIFSEGDLIQGFASPVNRLTYLRFSSAGTHYGGSVTFADGTPSIAMIDGQAVMNQGVPIQIGQLVEPNLGAGSPSWFRTYQTIKTESGNVWVAGADDGGNNTAGLVMKDGEVVLRQGDMIDGFRLQLAPNEIIVAPDGEPLITWTAFHPAGFNTWVIIRDGHVVLHGGMELDADGSGQTGQGLVINYSSTTSTGGAEFSIDQDHVLRGIAYVGSGPLNGRLALLELRLPFGEVACIGQTNSTGTPSTLSATGSRRVGGEGLTLRSSHLPPNQFGLLVVGRDAGFIPMVGGSMGDLCLGGTLGRFNGQVAASSSAGELTIPVNLGQLPFPTGQTSAMPGQTIYFQLWHRDTDSTGNPTSNLTPALAVQAR